jgi:integrase
MNDYLDVQRQRAKSAETTQAMYRAHILPKLGRRTIGALTTPMIRRWHSELATAPARIRGKNKTRPYDVNDREAVRKRKATANRILTVLKAGLNHAFREGYVYDDTAWRRVPPFENVDAPRVRFLTVREAQRLVNSSAPDLRLLVRGALLTGARYGELIALKIDDFDMTASTVYIRDSKGGKPRHIPLNDEGLRFFEEATAGRSFGDAMFTRANGHPWGKSHQARPMKEAVVKAKLKDVSFHILRHTYGSFLAAAGVPLQVIAAVLGHADTRTTEKHYAHLQPDHVAIAVREHLPTLSTEEGNVHQLA